MGARRLGLVKTLVIVIAINVLYRLGLQLAINESLIARHSLLATAVLPNFFLGRWAEFGLGMAAAAAKEMARRKSASLGAFCCSPIL